MTKNFIKILLTLVVISITACTKTAYYPVNPYGSYDDNKALLKAIGGDMLADVGDFTTYVKNTDTIGCGGVTGSRRIIFADDGTLERYIKNALVKELDMADMYLPGAPIRLTGQLNAIELKTTITGEWHLDVTIRSSNGHTLTYDSYFDFPRNWSKDRGCQQAAESLVSAVQVLLRSLINHPEFKFLLNPAT